MNDIPNKYDYAVPKADERQISGNHYKDMPIQPWAIMEAVMTTEEFRGFLCGNVIKYSLRAGRKEGSDDAGKAKHYMQKLKEFDEKMRHMRNCEIGRRLLTE